MCAETLLIPQRPERDVIQRQQLFHMPFFSVIIPTYNRATCVGRAIESVLRQTFQDYELIVVDDGSTDKTAEVVRQYGERIVFVSQPNRGVSAARNAGVSRAAGDWVAFLDSDDEWLPG